LAGNWSGNSICQVKDSPCRDEQVVYHISKGSDPAHWKVAADKIVAGKAIDMGEGTFTYDQKTAQLRAEDQGRVWLFTVKGNTMSGTLTMPDKTIYRRVSLKKDD